MDIYFLRHGDKILQGGDVDLNELGMAQARTTGESLKQVNLERILTSPYRRTQTTARLVAEKLGLPFSLDERLKERLIFGEIPSQTYAEYLDLCDQSTADRDLLLPNGLSSRIVGQKILELVEELKKEKVQAVLLISHGGAITDFLRSTFSDEILANASPDFAQQKEVRHCSLTRVVYDNHYQLVSLNDTTHLKKALFL